MFKKTNLRLKLNLKKPQEQRNPNKCQILHDSEIFVFTGCVYIHISYRIKRTLNENILKISCFTIAVKLLFLNSRENSFSHIGISIELFDF